MRTHIQQIHLYAVLFLGGVTSSLPVLLTWQTLNLWLYELGYSKTSIALISIIGLPYSFKTIFAACMEHFEIPLISKQIGRLKSWFLVAHLILFLSLYGLAYSVTNSFVCALIFFGLITTIATCWFQACLYSFKTSLLAASELPSGVFYQTSGYYIGKLIGTAGVLYLLQYVDWLTSYKIVTTAILVSLASGLLFKGWPDQQSVPLKSANIASNQLTSYIVEPVLAFLRNSQHETSILWLILCCNLGEDLLMGLANIFYKEQGFSNIDIANISKSYGLFCLLVSGYVTQKFFNTKKLKEMCFASIIFHSISILVMILMTYNHGSKPIFFLCITIKNAAVAFKTIVFQSLITLISRKADHRTTIFAFLMTIKSIPLIVISPLSGLIKDFSTWQTFFLLSYVLCMPSLYFLLRTKKFDID